jgi:DNA-directed RNA polymerase subunit K/omega
MSLSLSRGPQIDTDLCVKLSGGNRFNLVIMAAARAKEIARKHREDERMGNPNSPVSALLDFQEGRCGPEYIRKVR